jgi:hypothetical protein
MRNKPLRIGRDGVHSRTTSLSLPRAAIAAAILLAGAVATAGRAQSVDVYAAKQNPAVQAAMSACTADRSRLCAYVIPGGGRIVRCLAAKPDQLSPACRSGMEQARDSLVAAGLVKQDTAGTVPLR